MPSFNQTHLLETRPQRTLHNIEMIEIVDAGGKEGELIQNKKKKEKDVSFSKKTNKANTIFWFQIKNREGRIHHILHSGDRKYSRN